MQIVSLKVYKARKNGDRGLSITIPEAYVKYNEIKPGDDIRVFLIKDDTTLLLLQVKK